MRNDLRSAAARERSNFSPGKYSINFPGSWNYVGKDVGWSWLFLNLNTKGKSMSQDVGSIFRNISLDLRKKRKDIPKAKIIPKPTNKSINKHLEIIRESQSAIKQIKARCKHEETLVNYRVNTEGLGITVGLFDSTLVCKKCGTESILKNSPPVCQCCIGSLVLKIWDGKRINSATLFHAHAWTTEHERRQELSNKDPLGYSMFFNQIGLYVCSNRKCAKHNIPVYIVTEGD